MSDGDNIEEIEELYNKVMLTTMAIKSWPAW